MSKFRVIPLWEDTPDNVQIEAGVHFGCIGQGIRWRVTSEMVETPIEFTFKVLLDKGKKKAEIEFKYAPNEERSVAVLVFNPPESGSCGVESPMHILNWDDKFALGFMYQVDRIRGANYYRLTYAFYDSAIRDQTPSVAGGE